MLIIGSKALEILGILPEGREIKDLDIICTEKEAEKVLNDCKDHSISKSKHGYVVKSDNLIIEFEVAKENTNSYELLEKCDATDNTKSADIDTLYMLKMSHRYLKDSPHFYKTMADIKHLRSEGAKIPPDMVDWYKERERLTYDYLHPKLNVSKDDFFTDDVPYKYDHDTIHLAVAIDNVPAYTRFLTGEVKTSKSLFESLPFSQRLNAVLEESCVLALERSLIPFGYKDSEHQFKIFQYALMKVCTSITSGWFREFAWENYNLCCKLYSYRVSDYVDKFEDARIDGVIMPYNGSKY